MEPFSERIVRVRQAYKEARAQFAARLRNASEADAHRAGADGGWSAAQIGWHVAAVDASFAAIVSGASPAATPVPDGQSVRPWSEVAAGIPGKVRVIYIYGTFFGSYGKVEKIEPGVTYTAFFWDPRTGAEYPIGPVRPDANGSWVIPREPELTDWVLVLEH